MRVGTQPWVEFHSKLGPLPPALRFLVLRPLRRLLLFAIALLLNLLAAALPLSFGLRQRHTAFRRGPRRGRLRCGAAACCRRLAHVFARTLRLWLGGGALVRAARVALQSLSGLLEGHGTRRSLLTRHDMASAE